MTEKFAVANKPRKYANTEWHTRIDYDRPYQSVKIVDDDIQIGFMPGNKMDGYAFKISRADARLLAKRINECLDATVKK